MSTVEEIRELLRELPEELQAEVLDFARFLAKKHGLTLGSVDAGLDRTDRGRKTPADVLREAESGPGPG